MNEGKEKKLKVEHIIFILIITYLYVNPYISVLLSVMMFLVNKRSIYTIIIITPLLENILPLAQGFTISKAFAIIYMLYFLHELLKRKFKLKIFKYEILLYYIYLIVIVFGLFRAITNDEIVRFASSSQIISENINLLLVIINSIVLFIDFSDKELYEIKSIVLDFAKSMVFIFMITFVYNLTHSIKYESWGLSRTLIANADPNEYSSMICAFSVPILFIIFNYKNKLIKISAIIAFGLGVLMILQTASKAGLLSLIILMILYIFFLGEDIKHKVKIIIALLMLSTVIILLNPDLVNNVLSRFTMFEGDVSSLTTGRADFWRNGITYTMENNFLFGLAGTGKSEIYINLINGLSPHLMHNLYVSIFVKYGLIGLICFMLLVCKIIFSSIKYKNYVLKTFLVFPVMIMVLLFSALSLSWDYNAFIWSIIGISLGIMYVVKNKKDFTIKDNV